VKTEGFLSVAHHPLQQFFSLFVTSELSRYSCSRLADIPCLVDSILIVGCLRWLILCAHPVGSQLNMDPTEGKQNNTNAVFSFTFQAELRSRDDFKVVIPSLTKT